MSKVCLYFHVHQPFRLRKFSVFDIGKSREYFDEEMNRRIAERVAKKCYLPANDFIREAIAKCEDFKVAYSITGCALEQFERYTPEVLESFEELVSTGAVELLSESYYHSLAFIFDKKEYAQQVRMHEKTLKGLFKQKPTVFRNTELIYNNELAKFAEQRGYKAILAEGWDKILGWRSPNYVYKAKGTKKLRLLLKNYRLSDDIAFRFSKRDWEGWPLTAERFAHWIEKTNGDSINLFLDYETFGEHQWLETGIFEFLKQLPLELRKRGIGFVWPSELARLEPKDELDVKDYLSWADTERDISAWLGNPMQKSASEQLYALKEAVLKTKDEALIESWRKLTTSDHFYYMCTKWFNDGDVHKYFNPYDSPYECFINMMNIIADVRQRVANRCGGWKRI
ncbi:MAG: glycoside hydrolase family 57 protein [Candidatus Woesearchaeota archaeon]